MFGQAPPTVEQGLPRERTYTQKHPDAMLGVLLTTLRVTSRR